MIFTEPLTAKDMQERAIEALETYRSLRVNVGPSSKSGYWPDIVGELDKGDRAPEETRVIRIPTAAEIAGAERFTGWVNAYLGEEDRKEVWTWARLKVIRSRTIRGFCEKMGLREHEYRRRIGKIFQKLASSVSGNPALLRSASVDDPAESGEKRASSGRGARRDGFEVWRPDEAKPEHLPDSDQHKRLVSNLLKKQKQRSGASPRAA